MARTMGRASTKCLLFAKVVKKNESPKLFNYFLALISFCRDRAEKYLANVTQKLENINMILFQMLL